VKPRIRPVMRAGESLIWECVGYRGWRMWNIHFRGHGYTPKEAFDDWMAQL
jgi:hypothetical protein